MAGNEFDAPFEDVSPIKNYRWFGSAIRHVSLLKGNFEKWCNLEEGFPDCNWLINLPAPPTYHPTFPPGNKDSI